MEKSENPGGRSRAGAFRRSPEAVPAHHGPKELRTRRPDAGAPRRAEPVKTIQDLAEVRQTGRRVCLALGFFDGVHLGHQQIIRQTTADARQHEALALLVTFDRHPNTVVAPERTPPLIYPLTRKLKVIESFGVDQILLLHFDKAFSERSGEEFVRSLANQAGQLRSICVGANFVFGHKRSGNVEQLRKLGAELHFAVHGLSAVALDGRAVSSTRIRQAISAGNLDGASQMLGRAYSLLGPVVAGDKVGRQLGVPTANLDVNGLVLPPNGVYAAQVKIADQLHRAVVNIGSRPTLQSPKAQLRVEAHLLDFSADLYGRELELFFVEKLRDEKKFPSLDALRQQISQDIAQARTKF
jgi:riboflavin kinase/FMN adenylyltransferase